MNDQYFLAQAFTLARRGIYTTDPNPRVGCVIVRDGQIIGEGFHQSAGQDHAEVVAIDKVEAFAFCRTHEQLRIFDVA